MEIQWKEIQCLCYLAASPQVLMLFHWSEWESFLFWHLCTKTLELAPWFHPPSVLIHHTATKKHDNSLFSKSRSSLTLGHKQRPNGQPASQVRGTSWRPGQVILLCFGVGRFPLTMHLPTQEYKWVLVKYQVSNLWYTGISSKRSGKPSKPCNRDQDKLGWIGHYVQVVNFLLIPDAVAFWSVLWKLGWEVWVWNLPRSMCCVLGQDTLLTVPLYTQG